MSLSRTVATKYEVDGRKFVDTEDFLACYPNASKEAKTQIRQRLETFNGDVEKRIEGPLVERLMDTCWCNTNGLTGALYAPIVLRDGWVIWVSQGHEPLIDSLGHLFVERVEPKKKQDEIQAWISGETPDETHKPNTDLLTGGYAWYVSTATPKIVWTGKAYRPTKDDRYIFQIFEVRQIY